MGRKIYTTIIKYSKNPDPDKQTTSFDIPLDATAQDIVNITGMSLEMAVDFLKRRIEEDSVDCLSSYCSSEISEVLTRVCPPGTEPIPATYTYTLDECYSVSNISKQDADSLARSYFDNTKEGVKFNNIRCVPLPLECNTEISDEAIKSNCPPGSIGLPVPFTVQANQFCNIDQSVAQQQAQDYFNSLLQTNADSASSSVYCQSLGQQCNDEQSQEISYQCTETSDIITDTITVNANVYCSPVLSEGGEATAKSQANAQAVTALNNLIATTGTDYLAAQCPEPPNEACLLSSSFEIVSDTTNAIPPNPPNAGLRFQGPAPRGVGVTKVGVSLFTGGVSGTPPGGQIYAFYFSSVTGFETPIGTYTVAPGSRTLWIPFNPDVATGSAGSVVSSGNIRIYYYPSSNSQHNISVGGGLNDVCDPSLSSSEGPSIIL